MRCVSRCAPPHPLQRDQNIPAGTSPQCPSRHRPGKRSALTFADSYALVLARLAAPVLVRAARSSTRGPVAAHTCEHHVNKAPPHRALTITLLLPALLLTGCGTPPAKDFRGHWQPVNRFQSTTTEIPLNRPYTYYASPMDETLKNMVTRWATDTGMTLVYRLPSDYTLFAPVAKVRTADIHEAASELSSIYASEGVAVTVEGEKLRVGSPKALGSDINPASAPQQPAAARVHGSSATAPGVR